MPKILKTSFLHLYSSDEVLKLYNFGIILFIQKKQYQEHICGSKLIFPRKKMLVIYINVFIKDYNDRVIAILSFYEKYDFKLVVKKNKKKMHLDLTTLKSILIFEKSTLHQNFTNFYSLIWL